MNEFTIGFEVEFSGTSERFVSEEAYKTQQKLKDEYMSRDTKHMETISELKKQLTAKQDYIKTLEERIASQRTVIKSVESQKLDAQLKYYSRYKEDIMEKDNTIAQLEAHNENQRKELANLNKVLERERKRNKELEELYSGAQKDVSMLNLKVMELNQGICNSAVLTWKEKYDELETKYKADSDALNAVINELRIRIKSDNEHNNETCKKLADDLAYITDRCSKAEHTINAIKEILKEE